MPYYRCGMGKSAGGGYTQEDIDSYYINVGGEKYLPDMYLFENNQTINETIIIGNNVTVIGGLLANCSNFNQPVFLGEKVTNCYRYLYNCSKFNCPVNIGENVVYGYSAFESCSELNSPINIKSTNIYPSRMFKGCSNFNQPVNIPSGANNFVYMFGDCFKFNQPVSFYNNFEHVINASYMFQNCNSLNQIITVPNCANIDGFYLGCVNLPPQSVIIPAGVVNCYGLFQGAKITDVYFKGNNSNRNLKCGAFFGRQDVYGPNIDNSIRHNVYFNNVYQEQFYNQSGGFAFAYVAKAWTNMSDGNGFYNAQWNIYCYNNYAG